MQGHSPSTHLLGAPPQTPGDFRFTTKVTKGVPGLCPWTPLGGIIIPPAAHAPFPPERVCPSNPDRFATLSLWANRSFFRPGVGRGHTFWFQAVARGAAIRGLDTANRALTTNNDNQGVKTFLSIPIYYISFLYIVGCLCCQTASFWLK